MIENASINMPYSDPSHGIKGGENNRNDGRVFGINEFDDGLICVSTNARYVEPFANNYRGHFFNICHSFINESDYDIVAVNRNNIPSYVPKMVSGRPGGLKQFFTVRTSIHVRNNRHIREFMELVQKAIVKLPLSGYGIKRVEEELKAVLTKTPDTDLFEIAFDHVINVEELGSKHDVYMTDVDFLIVGHKDFGKNAHPFSEDRKTQRYLEHNVGNRDVAGTIVEIVDNGCHVAKRYMYVSNQIVEVPIVRDKQRKDGVYWTLFNYELGVSENRKTQCLTLEEADNLIGLFKTKEEALSHYSKDISETQDKIELKRLEKEFARYKYEAEHRKLERQESFDEVKYQREIEKLEKEKKRDRLNWKEEKKKYKRDIKKLNKQIEQDEQKHRQEEAKLISDIRKYENEVNKLRMEAENAKRQFVINEQSDILNMRKAQRSDFYEERSHVRKDTSEWYKFVPHILTGAVAIAGAFYAMNRK